MSGGHRLSLPYTLTCFHCHFEPRLEACLPRYATGEVRLEHQTDCVGLWELLWLADERFLYCPLCHGGTPANEALMARAEAENEIGKLLAQLTDEGQPLI